MAHIGTGSLNYLIGVIRTQTGSFPMALMPLAGMCFVGVLLVLYIGNRNSKNGKTVQLAT
ncbi:hypothetical protein D3C71_1842820 [compost metagenome]